MREQIHRFKQRVAQCRESVPSIGRKALIVLIVTSLMIPFASLPAAASTAQPNTTVCQYGAPIPSDLTSGESAETDIELALTLDGTTFSGLSDQESVIESSSRDMVGRLDSGDEASVVSFSEPTETLQVLSGDLEQVNESIGTYDVTASSSYIDRGIDSSTDQLTTSANSTESAKKVMVVLSDGNANDPAAARNSSTAAKDQGILIITVAFGDNPDTELMEDLATSPEYAYSGTEDLDAVLNEVEDDITEIQQNRLRVETRNLILPGNEHPYDVYNVTYGVENNETVIVDKDQITENATVTSSNTSVITVNQTSTSLIAASDANTSTWARINATYNGLDGCANVVVAEPTVDNLRILPGALNRLWALFDDPTIFALLIAGFLSVPAARFTNSFGGLATAQMVVTIGWLSGYIGTGIAMLSVFVALFIGLNLAENVQFNSGNFGGGFR